MQTAPTLSKRERLCSKKLIDQLFSTSAQVTMAAPAASVRPSQRSIVAYPVRMVWMETARSEGEAASQVMVSVSKRHFKRAVKRNRVKRQLREAWRNNKYMLYERLQPTPCKAVVLALIWLADELRPSAEVNDCVRRLTQRLAERL